MKKEDEKFMPSVGSRAFSHETDYTKIHTKVLRNKELSYAARGVLAYLMSNKEDFPCTDKILVSMSNESLYAVKKYTKELQEKKYLHKISLRCGSTGKVYQWKWVFWDEPIEVDSNGIPRLIQESTGNLSPRKQIEENEAVVQVDKNDPDYDYIVNGDWMNDV